MKFRQTENQVTAAAKAGISERSARRIDKHELQPKTEVRSWCARPDPLTEVWESIVVPILQKDSEITPVGIFDHLCEYHSDAFTASSRCTYERRIGKWRHLYGPSKDVVFLQAHHYGELAFTQVIYGGESFTAFSDGLQNALIAAQGVPQKLCTDSLSAAYKN